MSAWECVGSILSTLRGALRRAPVFFLAAAPIIAQAPFKVFMIAGTDAVHTATTQASVPALQKMAAANNFILDITTDRNLINDGNLAKYQVFIQVNSYPFDYTPEQRTAFQKYVEGGKGWVGVHGGGVTYDNWPWFQAFLGDTYWVTHAAFRGGTLIFEDRTHPVTRSMPASMKMNDEWYEYSKSPRPKVRVLARADEANFSPIDPKGDHPMVWCNEAFPKTIYISPGHDPAVWTNASYLTLIRDAILWAAPTPTRLEAFGEQGGPRPEKAWIRNGLLHLGAEARRWRVDAIVRLLDARGRRVGLAPSGNATFHILGPAQRGIYYLSVSGYTVAMPVVWDP